MIQNLARVENGTDTLIKETYIRQLKPNDAKGKAINIFDTHKSHIRVRNLNIYLSKNHILKNVCLDIPDKAITCIIGPSGCGKNDFTKNV